MRRVVKFVCITLIMSVVLIGCHKDDDDNIPVRSSKLTSIKYGTNKIDVKSKVAITSKNATVSPKGAVVTFRISKIMKDKKSFTNPKSGGFKIDSKGVISAPKDHKLGKGKYELTIMATTKKDKKDKKDKVVSKTTTFTVAISEPTTSKLVSISYSPNKLSGKQKTVLIGKKATLNPKDASVSFKISTVTKDKKSFVNPKSGGFKIDSMGKIGLAKNHKLAKGTYELTIIATDKGDKKNKKKTKLMVVMG